MTVHKGQHAPGLVHEPALYLVHGVVYKIFSRLVAICSETGLFVSIISVKVQNTKTNRNKPKIIGFMKQTKKQPKQFEFRFEPKIFFVCFEDTLLLTFSEL
jgi:hypothetical protein